jgi:hypothetical protein
MKILQIRAVFVAVVMFAALSSSISDAALLFGEGITKNENGDYIITYMAPEEQRLVQVLYIPPNKINPLLNSSMKLDHDWKIVYHYAITNRRDSRQPLVGLTLDPISSIKLSRPQQDLSSLNNDALSIPSGWDSFAITSKAGGYRANWIYGKLDSEKDGLQLGQTQAGFGFISMDLPGVQVAQLDGNGTNPSFMGEPDEDIVALYDQLVKDTAFVRRNAAVPTIVVPTPFNASVLLGRIQSHVHTWITLGLLDATFSSQLDRYFQAAIDAYSHNQPKVAKEHIETLRKMLKREHEGIDRDEDEKADEKNDNKSAHSNIDRLAARVLDFDLKYVLKRMEEGKGKD